MAAPGLSPVIDLKSETVGKVADRSQSNHKPDAISPTGKARCRISAENFRKVPAEKPARRVIFSGNPVQRSTRRARKRNVEAICSSIRAPSLNDGVIFSNGRALSSSIGVILSNRRAQSSNVGVILSIGRVPSSNIEVIFSTGQAPSSNLIRLDDKPPALRIHGDDVNDSHYLTTEDFPESLRLNREKSLR